MLEGFRVYGVDFSGARDAGRRIWVARGRLIGGRLRLETCRPAETLPGSSRARERCFPALVDLVASQPSAVFGFDFPFGVPSQCCGGGPWDGLVLSVADRFPDCETFREACRKAAGGRELRRLTDRDSATPFCVYNLRLYRQTYHGLRDVLAPLVRSGAACVLPMHRPTAGKASVVEICPASTLKRQKLYRPYKGKRAEHRRARRNILTALEQRGLDLVGRAAWKAAVQDDGGDALDSMIAAFATGRALEAGFPAPDDPTCLVEGYVYV